MSWTRNPNDGTQLYYEAQGQGEPLVLIMGLGGSVAAWGMQWAAFTRAHRVIALDNRGSGRSDKPDAPYDTAAMADDVLAVMDAAGVASAAVLGVSMGGLIAQCLYQRAPDRVTRLILAASGPPIHSPDHESPTPAAWAALQRDRYRTDTRELIEDLVEVFYHPDYRRRIPNLVDWLVNFEAFQGQPAHAYHRQLAAILDDRTTPDQLETITIPTQVIHGRDDRVWPVSNAERMTARLPYGQLRIVEGAGHMLMLEQPRAFNSAVLEFTQTQRA
jgi:pimeloyl-ACP methyl ester carboxylesterase